MPTPLVSVLITAYNREKYIAEAIQSVLAQTFSDFELIVVDDGSKDRTVEIARHYTSDPRVRLHVNEKNLGDYRNRNRAAELAQGTYLKYLDSDDVLYPHGLEVMVNTMRRYPGAALGLCRPSFRDRPHPILLSPQESYREHFLGRGLFGEGPTGAIILTSAFRNAGGFSGRRFVGDFELWLKLAALHSVVVLMEGLAWWRCHAEQEMSAETQLFPFGATGYSVFIDSLKAKACPLSEKERVRILHRLKRRHARTILRLGLLNRRVGTAHEIMRQTGFSFRDLLSAFASAE